MLIVNLKCIEFKFFLFRAKFAKLTNAKIAKKRYIMKAF
jgi:hypothetical protein